MNPDNSDIVVLCRCVIMMGEGQGTFPLVKFPKYHEDVKKI